MLEKDKADLREKVEVLARKVRSTQAIGSGEAELVDMKSLLDADLSDNVVRNRLSQAIRRVVTRIDLSFKASTNTIGVSVASLLAGSGGLVADPCPPKKTRKCLYIVVHFRHGGQRAIVRMPEKSLAKLKRPNVLFTGRV